VALESTLISHGLPYPQNVAVARASEAAIRAVGATPATVAIHAGRFLIGLDDAALEALARAPAGSVLKAARPSLAAALVGGGWAATTVSATMIAAQAAGIRVFATGGIGGVHRGAFGPAGATLDVSSDLEELARTPVAVVCAGPKAILDLPQRDLTGGYKLIRREVLEAIELESVRSQGYVFQVEITYRAVLAGFRVAEVPIVFHDRTAGTSKMSWRIALEAIWRVPRLRRSAPAAVARVGRRGAAATSAAP